MAHAIQVSVNPAVLKWARESSGSTVEEAAKRLKVPPTAFSKWEAAETPLKLSQLRVLAEYFKRPLAAFLLPAPPEESGPPSDFRSLPGPQGHFHRKTRLAIRKAIRLRSVAKDLMRAMQREVSARLEGAALSDDPEQIADRERDCLALSVEHQKGWQDQWRAFREWRAALEGRNILVFQFPMPVVDARGFSLSDEEPYAVAVSSSDAARARIFTLFHEYAHLLLRSPGVCLPGPDLRTDGPEAAVEKWCNRFAGAFLVPSGALRRALPTAALAQPAELFASVAEGSKLFKVSEQVVLRRLLDLELVSRASFQRAMQRLRSQDKAHTRGGAIVLPPKRCVAESGRLFTSLVLEAKGRELITYSDVADFLSLRLKYLPEVESTLMAAVV